MTEKKEGGELKLMKPLDKLHRIRYNEQEVYYG